MQTMKKHSFSSVLLLIAIVSITSMRGLNAQHSCTLSVPASEWKVDGRSNANMVRPGDTICLEPGARQFVWISYLHGTADAPVVVVNNGGLVDISGFYYGIKIDSCSHLILSGKGFQGLMYGIKIHDVNGTGLSIQGLSTDIEVESLEIARTELSGIIAKTDPDTADFSSTREKFVQRNTIIHDNYIHHTKTEGMYIGNSHYFGQLVSYRGKDTLVYPHALKGVQIYSNHMDSTGWDGIQVSSADSGCFIHHNYIYADSQREEMNQMSGILIGGGSSCDCYNNSIMNGKGDGIDVFGQGVEFVYNNFIFQAGRNYNPGSNVYPYQKVGIYAGSTEMNMPTSLGIHFNTIIFPKSYGIRVSDYPGTTNLASSNIIVGPGMYAKEGQQAFIMKENQGTDFSWFNNLTNAFCSPIGFRDTASVNYDLLPGSPGVDKGSYIDNLNLNWDFLCRWRPFARGYDIGAFECHDPILIGLPEQPAPAGTLNLVNPNPASENATLTFTLSENVFTDIGLYNSQGKLVRKIFNGTHAVGTYTISFSVKGLCPGEYHCILTTPSGKTSRTLIVKSK
jgi:hypothetical protein